MKKLITTLVVLAVLLIVFLMLGPFYILEEGEQAIVTRFGKIVDYQTESGLKFKMPVVDNVTKYTKKLLSWDGDAQRIPTKENQFIWVDATARWYISDVALFYETVGTIEFSIYIVVSSKPCRVKAFGISIIVGSLDTYISSIGFSDNH